MLLCFCLPAKAQFNVDQLITSGEMALHYEDFVLSIQYFNQAIASKPYLYQPWMLRAEAKYHLDDFVGAEHDATEAIKLNPYIDGLFDLRAVSRIKQQKYVQAIDDYNSALKLEPRNSKYWLNRAACRIQTKDYAQALAETDTMIAHWGNTAAPYSLKAEIYLDCKDTTDAVKWLDKSLSIDPYNADAWSVYAYISLNRRKWATADRCLTKVIHFKPRMAANYVNRAWVRINLNNLRGAMADYDQAINLDPENFLAHYNRGQLRMQLGDDNRAITDFNFIVKKEPRNFLAIFNRGILNERTGNLRAAIRDYSSVISIFPNFWTGLSFRARCYRKMGLNAKAELDEFRIFKAQMNKHLGIQPRWSRSKLRAVRKRSEINIDKYDQFVEDDTPQIQHEYDSEYRGHVQNRDVATTMLPAFTLSYFGKTTTIANNATYDTHIEALNEKSGKMPRVVIGAEKAPLTAVQSHSMFQIIDSLTKQLSTHPDNYNLLLHRAVAYSELQDYNKAVSDLDACLQIDSCSVLALWQRGVCQSMINNFMQTQGKNVTLASAHAIADISKAIALDGGNAWLYYTRGTLYGDSHQYALAMADFNRALKINPQMAEAWYNLGVACLLTKNHTEAVKALGKAGELGIYQAYALMKK